jgi:hypothetical protein
MYFIGGVGLHNVVIASLPAGVPGAASAVTVAADMQRTFPRVRVGLLVGDGSGAPGASDDADVRLGDVVISKPTDETGGVIEFARMPENGSSDNSRGTNSSGKNGGSGGSVGSSGSSGGSGGAQYVRTRCLNAPPRALLTALASLEAEHCMTGSKAPEYIAQAAQKFLRMKPFFTHPAFVGPAGGSGSGRDNDSGNGNGDGGDKSADQLYQASYEHVFAPSNRDCAQCDARKLVRRPPREFGGCIVHYGLIAS